MSDTFSLYKIGFFVLIPLSLMLFFYSIRGIKNELPDEDREYLDPLPLKLKMIWSIVNFFAHYCGDRISVDTLEKINKRLYKGGIAYLMSPGQFVGLRMTSSLLMIFVTYFCLSNVNMVSPLFITCAAFIGYFMPQFSLNKLIKSREKAIIKTLPVFLDYLTMATQAGMNMSGALQQAVDKGPPGPVHFEFAQILRDVKAGMPKLEAMKAMSERLELKQINTFVSAVVQAERTGASIGETLKIQSDQRRVERFQLAEKMAMQAPVKLIFPLVAFIFPTTFIILLFPIAMQLLKVVNE